MTSTTLLYHLKYSNVEWKRSSLSAINDLIDWSWKKIAHGTSPLLLSLHSDVNIISSWSANYDDKDCILKLYFFSRLKSQKAQILKWHIKCKRFKWYKWFKGCRHSSVDSSAPTIMPLRVRVPSTPSTLFIIYSICAIFVMWKELK